MNPVEIRNICIVCVCVRESFQIIVYSHTNLQPSSKTNPSLSVDDNLHVTTIEQLERNRAVKRLDWIESLAVEGGESVLLVSGFMKNDFVVLDVQVNQEVRMDKSRSCEPGSPSNVGICMSLSLDMYLCPCLSFFNLLHSSFIPSHTSSHNTVSYSG
jgi:hypothetical protein